MFADYVDSGGGVVLATYGMSSPWWIQGRIATSGYAPLMPSANLAQPSGAVFATDASDPIFAGVNLPNLTGTFFINQNFAVASLDEGPWTSEDAARSIAASALTANDTDSDYGAVLTVSAVSGLSALGANILLVDGVITYDPRGAAVLQGLAAGETAQDTFTYTVSDGLGGFDTATVTVTVAGVNGAPVAVGDAFETDEDTSRPISAAALLANDADPDGDALLIQAVDGFSTFGTVQLTQGGDIIYTPGSALQFLKPGQTAQDRFGYTVADGRGGTGTETVTMTIAGVNDAPTAVSDSAFVNAGSSATIAVLANDTDPERDPLLIIGIARPAHGTAVLNEDGGITYTPVEGFSGEDSFTYTVSDGTMTGTATVALVVGRADHDALGGDVFLQGNFMEIGVSSAGSLGTANDAPANYHPMNNPSLSSFTRQISYVVDPDGWDIGAAPQAGDFTLPGSPVDTIVFGFNGVSFVQDQRSGRNDIGTTTTDVSSDSHVAAETVGIAGESLQIKQLIELDPGATYYKTTIMVENVSGDILHDVRFMRSFDPDQDVFRSETFNTFNDVLSNPTGGNDLAVARATGVSSGVSVNLVAFDSAARASNFGFANYDAYGAEAWDLPVDANGAEVDEAITLAFRLGDLAVGQTVKTEFYTSLNGNQNANDMTIGTGDADTLDCGLGNDIVLGLAGADELTGNAGDDIFIVGRGSGADTVTDFVAGASTDDHFELRGFGLSKSRRCAPSRDRYGGWRVHRSRSGRLNHVGGREPSGFAC